MISGRSVRACLECGSVLKQSRGDYAFIESGLENVVLRGITVLHCPRCGTDMPRIPRLNELMRTIAFALISKPYPLTGKEIRFLRKFLAMTGEQFAKVVHVDKTTLSKWENGEDPVGAQSDRLIRLVTLGLGERMQERSREVIRNFEKIQKRKKPVKLTVVADTHEFEYAA